MKRIIWGLAAWGLLLAGVVGQARADFIASATLLGANERPTPNNSLGTGTAAITFLAGPDELVYLVTFSNLSGPATAAHIHLGPATISGPVILPFPLVPAATSGSFSGVLTNANIVNQGTTGLTDISQIAAQIQANNTYVNIHSSVFPGGEIRGQLSVEPAVAGVPEPSSITLLGIGLVGIAGSAWRRCRNKLLAIA